MKKGFCHFWPWWRVVVKTNQRQVRNGEEQGRRLHHERREPALPHVSATGAPLGRDGDRHGGGAATVNTVVGSRQGRWVCKFGGENKTEFRYKQWSRSALYCPFVLKRAFLSPKILYCSFKDSLWPLLPFFDNIYCKFLSIFSKTNTETGLMVSLSLGFVPHLPN